MSYYSAEGQELHKGRIPVKLLGDSGEVFYELALEMVRIIEENNAKGESEKIMQAMGIRSDKARNAVRLSFSNDTSDEDAAALASAIKELC